MQRQSQLIEQKTHEEEKLEIALDQFLSITSSTEHDASITKIPYAYFLD